MRSILTSSLLVGTLALGLAACTAESSDPEGSDDAPAVDTEAACLCEKGKAGEAVWCADCGEGYVDGKVATKCEGCFKAKQGGPPCPT